MSPSTRDLQLLSLASSSPDQLSRDKSIRISEVTYEDEGTYRCGGNVAQQRLTRTMQLVVAKSKFLLFQFEGKSNALVFLI